MGNKRKWQRKHAHDKNDDEEGEKTIERMRQQRARLREEEDVQQTPMENNYGKFWITCYLF